MPDWLQNLPVVWMTVVVFLATYLATAAIYWVVVTLAVGERARAFKAVSPGMLPPLGIIFGLPGGICRRSSLERFCRGWHCGDP